ncbi:MAG: InlB B-repeat-containing protein [Dehalococcoidia bacterium]|nr:InlB B-repeat-containing protein [Dehalococcoidia bacterium]
MRQVKTVVFSFLLSCTLVISTFLLGLQVCSSAVIAAEANLTVATEVALKQAVNGAPTTEQYVIELTSDITLTAGTTLTITAGKDIVLVGNNKLIGANNMPTITVSGLGTLTIDGITVTHNSGAKGSGVYVSALGSLYMSSGKIIRNLGSDDGGGGVFVDYGGRFAMTGGEISENSAIGGGGVLNCGTFTVEGGKISNNSADYFAGGVYNESTCLIRGGEISGNSVSSGLAGGLFSLFGTITMSGGKISDNYAPIGGGMCIESGVFNFNGGEISGNIAAIGGGLVSGGTINLRGGKISDNSAEIGGGGVFHIDNTFNMYSGVISGNSSFDGGGVFNGATFIMTGGEISANEAMNDGGGIVIYDGTFNMSGGIIANNFALVDGGAIWVDDTELSSITISGDAVFASNKASGAYNRSPYDDALYNSKIAQSVTWTTPFTQGYNNYDISYTSGTSLAIVEFMWNYDNNDQTFVTVIAVEMNTPIGNNLPAVPSRPHHMFSGWNTLADGSGTTYTASSPNLFNATTLYAQWLEDPKYAVTYQPGTHGTFSAQTSEEIYVDDPTPAAPITYSEPGWRFIGWSPELSAVVSGDVTYVAQWEQITHEVTVVDWDNAIIDRQVVIYGNNAEEPVSPIREGYVFVNWDRSFTNITADITIKAQYSQIILTVIFVDSDGTALDTQLVPYGSDAIAPNDPVRNGYTFTGWSNNFTNVETNLTITARYKWNFPVIPVLIITGVIIVMAVIAFIFIFQNKKKKGSLPE